MLKHQIKYLLFCVKAKYRFGIHSPFVFQLNEYFHKDSEWQSLRKNPFKPRHLHQINPLFQKKIKAFFHHQNDFTFHKIHCVKASDETLGTHHKRYPKTDILIFEEWYRYRKNWRKKLNNCAYIKVDFYFWMVCFKRNQADQTFLIRLL